MWSCFIFPYYGCSKAHKYTGSLFFKVGVGMLGICISEPKACCAQSGSIPLAAFQLSCSTLGSTMVLELSVPGSSARGSAGWCCCRGGMSLKVAVASPVIYQDQLICRSFSFIVPVIKKRSLGPWLPPAPCSLWLFLWIEWCIFLLNNWIWLILLGFFHWQFSCMWFEWPNQALLC